MMQSEASNICNAAEGHCLQAMKILHHLANGRFDWLISGHQSVNPLRKATFYNVSEIQKNYVCPLIWEMRNYLDANNCFHTISFHFASLSHNFYSFAKLVTLYRVSQKLCYNPAHKALIWVHLLDVQGVGIYLFIHLLALIVQDFQFSGFSCIV